MIGEKVIYVGEQNDIFGRSALQLMMISINIIHSVIHSYT